MTISDEFTPTPLATSLRRAARLAQIAARDALAHEGVDRRDLRALRAVEAGTDRNHPFGRIARLIERGWAHRDGDRLALTDVGAEKLARVTAALANVDERIAAASTTGAVAEAGEAGDSPTLAATLDAIVTELGGVERLRAERNARHEGHGGRRHGGRGHGHRHSVPSERHVDGGDRFGYDRPRREHGFGRPDHYSDHRDEGRGGSQRGFGRPFGRFAHPEQGHGRPTCDAPRSGRGFPRPHHGLESGHCAHHGGHRRFH